MFKKRDAKGILTETQTNHFYGFKVEEAIFQNNLDYFLIESSNLLKSISQGKMDMPKEQVMNIFL